MWRIQRSVRPHTAAASAPAPPPCDASAADVRPPCLPRPAPRATLRTTSSSSSGCGMGLKSRRRALKTWTVRSELCCAIALQPPCARALRRWRCQKCGGPKRTSDSWADSLLVLGSCCSIGNLLCAQRAALQASTPMTSRTSSASRHRASRHSPTPRFACCLRRVRARRRARRHGARWLRPRRQRTRLRRKAFEAFLNMFGGCLGPVRALFASCWA
mmetsp:Transcript_141031/g.451003  ORF Transcript_141031/g.451003 Transcript_141031/m.451003 type:complete len:216 (-) Transcript_141031:1066-1713(-)